MKRDMHFEDRSPVTAAMKTRLQTPTGPTVRFVTTLSLLFFLMAGGVARASIRWATLEAIHQLENPQNLTRPGPFGELGPYQFRSSTWHMHSNAPFEKALDRQVSDEVAVRHYEWLKRGLEEAKVPATPYNIGLAWNGGLGGVIARTSPRVAHEYASRVANLAAALDGGGRLADAH